MLWNIKSMHGSILGIREFFFSYCVMIFCDTLGYLLTFL